MQLQAARCQARVKFGLEGYRFLLASAVHQPIVGIPTPPEVGAGPRHPEIERVVKKGVRQDRADHTPLGRTAASLDPLSRFIHHRRFEPSLNVQQRPLARYVFPDSPHQQRVVDVVKQAFNVKFQNPIVFPAPLARHSNGIQCRLSRPIAVRVCQKY
jgi:hypothetical protein